MSDQFSSIPDLINAVKRDCTDWGKNMLPWFRGEPAGALDNRTQLLPSIYRKKEYDEDQLLQNFRLKASVYGQGTTPPRDGHTDQWLFLAQHHGLPTRLLDWSEGALIGLFFALLEDKPVLWMLNPIGLNNLSLDADKQVKTYSFKWTWVESDKPVNIYNQNIRGAWQNDAWGTEFPVAVLTTYTHPRMSAQKSCFTVHGKRKEPLDEQVPPKILKRYEIKPEAVSEMRKDLSMLGISHSTIYPDLKGLADDLRNVY